MTIDENTEVVVLDEVVHRRVDDNGDDSLPTRSRCGKAAEFAFAQTRMKYCLPSSPLCEECFPATLESLGSEEEEKVTV